jgi:hypothetical protein
LLLASLLDTHSSSSHTNESPPAPNKKAKKKIGQYTGQYCIIPEKASAFFGGMGGRKTRERIFFFFFFSTHTVVRQLMPYEASLTARILVNFEFQKVRSAGILFTSAWSILW